MRVQLNTLKEQSVRMRELIKKVEEVQAIDELRGLEGVAASGYFGVFQNMILNQEKEFVFENRSRRPPMDNVNALLSFTYSLLMNDVKAALETVGLDPYVGFLHTIRSGRASLALDMMEELRAPVADRFVLTLINQKMVKPSGFNKKENGAVIMDDDTRKTMLSAWQKRKQEQFTHPFLKEKISWGLLPYTQALLLARFMRKDLDAYPVFLWK